MDIAIGADCLDVVDNGDCYTILTEPDNFLNVKESFENNGITDFLKSEVTYVASNKIALNDEDTEKVMNLIEALEDIDDVSDVYHNLDI